jgi:subtilisin family serine protease
VPAGSAFALKVERLSRFSPLSGKASFMEVAGGVASVKFPPGVSTAAAAGALSAAGFSLSGRPAHGAWRLVHLPAGMSVQQGLTVLKSLNMVSEAEPDKIYRPELVPDDPDIPQQYALGQIQAFGAWEYETGSSNRVTVAVIDTGIDSANPEFSGKFSDSSSQFCDPGSDKINGSDSSPCVTETTPAQACYHGTAVAGVAAAHGNNSIGISGVSWGARLVSLRVFRVSDCAADCAADSCTTDDWAMADALDFLASNSGTAAYGRIVANLSLGCRSVQCGTCSGMMQAAVGNAISKGVMIFAAAGNGGDVFLDSPADCPGVIAVGATDQHDDLASFSTTDSTMTYMGITAPGVDIFTTTLNSGYTTVSGTSFSTPMAAGLAALLWSAKPGSSGEDIWDYIRDSADDLGAPGPDRDFGWGRINAMKALRLAETGSATFAGTKKAVSYPNPFRPKSQRLVTFSVPAEIAASGVEVRVYTSEGELVRKIDGLAWDGKNAAGADAASGVYLFKVKTDKGYATGKLALVR